MTGKTALRALKCLWEIMLYAKRFRNGSDNLLPLIRGKSKLVYPALKPGVRSFAFLPFSITHIYLLGT